MALDELGAVHVRERTRSGLGPEASGVGFRIGGPKPYTSSVVALTTISGDQLAELAREFALGEVRALHPIAAGTINSNFEVECARGRFFLRVNEGKREGDVAWEAWLVGELARRGVKTPPPREARDGRPYARLPGEDKWVSVFLWRDGAHLAEVTIEHARAFGGALARLHVAGLALGNARASIYDHAHLVARYRGFERSNDPALARAIAILGEELAEAERATPVRAAATHGIIHGDLFRDNVLWVGDDISAILDFEQASGGSLAYDLAVCVNDWCWDERAALPRADLARALLAGYESQRELPDLDRAALPIEIRAAAARFTITRITDVYLASRPNPAKDFRAFLARVESWRGPALGQVTSKR